MPDARTRLPVLDNLRVASPCKVAWSAMTGDDQIRHCGRCNKSVFNLTAMTRAQVELLVHEREQQPCVRYYQRADGTILLGDCAIGVRRRKTRIALVAGAAVALLGSAAVAIAEIGWVQGDLAVERPVEDDRGRWVLGGPLEHKAR